MPKGNRPGPTVKDPERYEALREQGYSKEKSARIANTPRKVAAQRGGRAEAYEDWTRSELYEKAQQVGIEGRSKMTKDDLIDALRNH